MRSEKAIVWNVTLDDGGVVLGNIELKDGASCSAPAQPRAERGRAMLSDALAGVVAAPLTEIQTLEQMRAAPPPLRPSARRHGHARAADPARGAGVRDMLDRQYRSLLDEPVSMLGNRTPREATCSSRGRRDLAVWLKHLENRSSHAPDPNDPMATYDFTWLWRELGIEHLRG